MNSANKTVTLLQIVTRRFSQSAIRRAEVQEVPSSKFKQLKEKQKFFQLDDHTPVHIKGGFGDRMLYMATLALTCVGLALSGEVLYKLSFPPKQN